MKLGNDYTWLSVWFRLQRVGDTFTTFQSVDGIEWFPASEGTAALPRNISAGLLVSGGGKSPGTDSNDPPSGLFDHGTLERTPHAPSAAPGSLKATVLPDNIVRLDWTNTANSNQAGLTVEASVMALRSTRSRTFRPVRRVLKIRASRSPRRFATVCALTIEADLQAIQTSLHKRPARRSSSSLPSDSAYPAALGDKSLHLSGPMTVTIV